jgi:hypothetical protein
VDGRIEACECATPEWRERIAKAQARHDERLAASASLPAVTSEAVA